MLKKTLPNKMQRMQRETDPVSIGGVMKKLIVLGVGIAAVLLIGPGFAQMAAAVQKVGFPFYVYKDGGGRENHFVPSGHTGDFGAIKMEDKCRENPQSGDSCIKFTYTGQAPQKMNWAGVFFQNPANNWGTSDGGYDLSGAKKLTFFARGNKGGENVEFKVGGVNGAYSDSDSATTGPVVLGKEWKQYQIPLEGLDLSYMFSGFAWVASSEKNPEGFVIYLDDILYTN